MRRVPGHAWSRVDQIHHEAHDRRGGVPGEAMESGAADLDEAREGRMPACHEAPVMSPEHDAVVTDEAGVAAAAIGLVQEGEAQPGFPAPRGTPHEHARLAQDEATRMDRRCGARRCDAHAARSGS